MRRILNPENWGGIILGENPDLGASSQEADTASGKFALKAVKARLSSGHRGKTLDGHLYLPGSTFDPAEHEPGTVVVYHQEALYAAVPEELRIDLNIFRNRVPPKRPTELQQQLGNKALISFAAETTEAVGVVFQESVRYGVIPPDYGRQHRRLITIPGSWVKPVLSRQGSELEDAAVCRVFMDNTSKRTALLKPTKPKVELVPIPIGSVRHFMRERPKDPDNPRLIKITQMEVLAA